MPGEAILRKVRTALGRNSGQPPAPVPEVRLRVPAWNTEERIAKLLANVEGLSGKPLRARSMAEARDYAAGLVASHSAIASNAPFLAECGITSLAEVTSGITDREMLREIAEKATVGITCADYALADPGTLVMISSAEEARMVSLLPPVHLAILPASRILTGLDELYTLLPLPMERSSAMVFITGPSRTADIEQILVRGVHGPGEIHVVVVE